jgi:hypothetical protein
MLWTVLRPFEGVNFTLHFPLDNVHLVTVGGEALGLQFVAMSQKIPLPEVARSTTPAGVEAAPAGVVSVTVTVQMVS